MRIRRSRSGGFTLIEILIVIAIIALLAALLAVGVVGMRRRAQNAKVQQLIRRLDIGCKTYFERYIAYPPANSPTAPLPGFSALGVNNSAVLLWFLGMPQPLLTGGQVAVGQPIDQFKRDEIEPAAAGGISNPNPATQLMCRPIIDAWGRRISYRNPPPVGGIPQGTNHATVVNPGVHDKGRDHTKYVDMWSWGADEGSRGSVGVGAANTILYSPVFAWPSAGAESGGYPSSGYGQDDIANWYEK